MLTDRPLRRPPVHDTSVGIAASVGLAALLWTAAFLAGAML